MTSPSLYRLLSDKFGLNYVENGKLSAGVRVSKPLDNHDEFPEEKLFEPDECGDYVLILDSAAWDKNGELITINEYNTRTMGAVRKTWDKVGNHLIFKHTEIPYVKVRESTKEEREKHSKDQNEQN